MIFIKNIIQIIKNISNHFRRISKNLEEIVFLIYFEVVEFYIMKFYADVAKKFDVKFDENESTNSIEISLLCKLIEEELKNSQDENTLRELVNISNLAFLILINKQL
ncbi:Uncharacterised protein [Campylobacter jejuni]|nr:Uncharacterised protein [Campylobacter jejuni]